MPTMISSRVIASVTKTKTEPWLFKRVIVAPW
jgi:hypothetical protein